jgi:hypothetical protein
MVERETDAEIYNTGGNGRLGFDNQNNIPLMVQYKKETMLSKSSYFKLKPEELQ